ncbi:hypothetical protein [Myroides odoratimimus]|uniref:hypothetical protein n=1 Tax=Myroides odoratimimus TaxID=76832 RepID=UPI000A4CF265|nr:hypothetical protein [Myroides odoratimimus]
MTKFKVTPGVVRNANNKLITVKGHYRRPTKESNNGAVDFKTKVKGKIYNIGITKACIKESYARSIEKTTK